MQKIKIKPMSINQARQGRRFKSKAYIAYEKTMFMLLKNEIIPDGELGLYIEVGYSNKASDIDNCVKPFSDILQKKYGFNDNRIYELHIQKKIVKKGEEYIQFSIQKL